MSISSQKSTLLGVLYTLLAILLLANCGTPGSEPQAPEINVRQTGTQLPNGAGAYDFEDVLADGDENSVSTAVEFTIENTGTAELNISLVDMTGNSGDFDLLSMPAATVASGGSTTFSIQFDPIDSGNKVAIIEISNNDSDENPYTFSVTGTGIANEPEIGIRQNLTDLPSGSGSYNFGSVPADGDNGYTSTNVDFSIDNFGIQNLTVSSAVFASGDTTDFDIISQPSSPIAPSGYSTLTISFDPLSVGAKSVVVSIDNSDSDENPYTFTVTGTGTPPDPEINVLQNTTQLPNGTGSYDFGSIFADGNNATTTSGVIFTIENSGTANLTVSMTIASGDTGDFDITGSPSSPITPGNDTTFTLQFDPLTIGSKSAVVSITNNDSDENPYTFTVTGIGTGGYVEGTIVDSVGGTVVPSVTVQLESTALSTTTNGSGYFLIYAPPGTYNILATQTGRAGSRMTEVVISNNSTTTIELISPLYAFSSSGSNPPTINISGITAGGTYSGTVGLGITAVEGSYPVAATYDHSAIMLKIGGKGSLISSASSDNGTLNYSWDTTTFLPGSIVINVVAYDINNNRCEWNIPVIVGPSSGTVPATAPSSYYIQASTFGNTLGIFKQEHESLFDLRAGLSAYEKILLDTTYAAADDSTVLVFLRGRRPASGTTGMNVYRADSQTGTYARVGSTTYYAVNTDDGYNYYQFYDTSSHLTPNQSYWYKLAYFNRYGEGPQMTAVEVQILDKYNLDLVSPGNNSSVSDTTPTFTWTADSVTSATRYDTIILKEVNGASYSWISEDLEDSFSTTCSVPLKSNTQYEWTISSICLYSVNSSVISISFPSQNDYATNGAFYFTVMP